MGNRSMFVGLDVHKETIDVSIAEGASGPWSIDATRHAARSAARLLLLEATCEGPARHDQRRRISPPPPEAPSPSLAQTTN